MIPFGTLPSQTGCRAELGLDYVVIRMSEKSLNENRQSDESFILDFPGGKWTVFAAIMGVTFILGAFIDWVGIIFVLVPILSPIIPLLGFDPLWFAMMIIVNLQMSFLTPPFAYAMFFLKGAADPALGLETKDIIRGMLPFVGIVAIGLILLIIFPQIVTWLPSTM